MSPGWLFCFIAFFACSAAGYRSLGFGVSVLLAVGYFYGILRANFLDGFSHFIFDAGILGLYLARFVMSPASPRGEATSRKAKGWLIALMGWPILLFFLPINHYLVQLVGLRHIVIFLPAMVLGARITAKDLETVTMALVVLNVVAFIFALFEYTSGIEPFFPRNSVTEIMYRSHDIRTIQGIFFRIPATFTSAHSYAGMMVLSLPFLVNEIGNSRHSIRRRVLMGAACVVTILAIFVAGPRLPVVQLIVFAALMLAMPGLQPSARRVLVLCIATVGIISAYYIANDPRMQRFNTLSDVEAVEQRANSSLQFSLGESFVTYPFGVGLGGVVGSSMPFFLNDLAPVPVGAENEYARIAVEQGIVGFLLWVFFLGNLFFRQPAPVTNRWAFGMHGMRAVIITSWATAFIGVGMLQAIPAAVIMLLQMGLLLREPRKIRDQSATHKQVSEMGRDLRTTSATAHREGTAQ
jgi:hypothetical protein